MSSITFVGDGGSVLKFNVSGHRKTRARSAVTVESMLRPLAIHKSLNLSA